MAEIWKDIPGYEGLYIASNRGRIMSLPRNTTHGGIIKQSTDKDGYKRVCLCSGKTKKNMFVHRIVASLFLENKNKYPVVNHKDENKSNNCVENLEWCTVRYNTNYRGANIKRGLRHRKPVEQYSLDGKFIAIYSGACEAMSAVGAKTHANITSCCTGKRKNANGYKWKYAK